MRCVRLSACTIVVLVLSGCSPPRETGTKGKGHAHDHPETGPHGGVLVEWGQEEYHAEFTVDHGNKQVTVYVLGPDAKTPAPIAADAISLSITNLSPPLSLTLKPDPQPDDPKGKSSRFRGTDDRLEKEQDYKGSLTVKIGDKPYSGDFDESKAEHSHPHKK
ncbi:MAG: hypothetical protein NZ700_02820 [Gemmataceae bacterium]|nr:hypothetical protein [Gemmataceae bacterium]MDW8265743.1 hypothetical protein [Gemmataceae bacterium]